MVQTQRVALAKFVVRGKESLVLIRPSQDGLMLHTMYFADEVRDFGEVDKGADAAIKPSELQLALLLIEELSAPAFRPEQYKDEYRDRVLAVVEQKVQGREVTTSAPAVQRTQVIDLMDALKQSLERRVSEKSEEEAPAEGKKPAAKAKATPAAAAPRERKKASK
jgi:DNA end-binding protein Ku